MRIMTFLSLVVLGAMFVCPAVAQSGNHGTVMVSGTGTVSVPPDQVELAITVMTEENDLLEARAESDKEIQEILDLGKTYGVIEGHFRVTQLNISYGYDEERRRFFYRVERAATMTLKDIGNFDALLAAALKRGGFNITGISFGTSKGAELEAKARSLAVADARARAAHLAELNGLKAGLARSISEGSFSQRAFATSVVPVVAGRRPFPNINDDPFARLEGATRKQQDAGKSESKVYFASYAQTVGEEGENVEGRGQTAAGLGVIETFANVNIEFDLVK